jgi:hypothetical protein
MTFMVDQDGVVLQKDLEPDTAKIAEMTRFAPRYLEWRNRQQPNGKRRSCREFGPVAAQLIAGLSILNLRKKIQALHQRAL